MSNITSSLYAPFPETNVCVASMIAADTQNQTAVLNFSGPNNRLVHRSNGSIVLIEKPVAYIIGERVLAPAVSVISSLFSGSINLFSTSYNFLKNGLYSLSNFQILPIASAKEISASPSETEGTYSAAHLPHQIREQHNKNYHKKSRLCSLMPKELSLVPVHQISTRVPGFLDLSPSEQVTFNIWKRTIEETYQLNGFNPLDLPPFVNRKFLLKKAGPEREIFSINRLPDNSMTNYGLAFDRTVPLALWVKGHQDQLSFPYKRYDISLSYREEPKMGIGQLHGFYQADVDIIGRNLPQISEVECITTIVDALGRLRIPEFEVYINNIEIPKLLIKQAGFKDLSKALHIIDSFGKNTATDIEVMLHELDPNVPLAVINRLVSICIFRGNLKDFPIADFESLKPYYSRLNTTFQLIESSGFDLRQFKFAPGIVRGLDYYTGMVFETFLTNFPKYGSIASGGRYDHLIDVFSEHPSGIEGVGGAIGFSRLFQILSTLNKIDAVHQTAAKVLIIAANDSFFSKATEIASKLRRKKIPTNLYTGMPQEIEGYLTYANKTGFKHTVFVKDSERFIVYRNSYTDENAFNSRGVVNIIAKL
jgi:histidyl-tRNA synthetase